MAAKNWAFIHIPDGLWHHIFDLLVHSTGIDNQTIIRSQETVQLSHICAKWRSIVLNAPELWSTIIVEIDRHGKAYPSEGLLRHALLHARDFPLTMSVSQSRDGESLNDHRALFSYLENMHRVRHLELSSGVLYLLNNNLKEFQAAQGGWEAEKPRLEELVFIPGPYGAPIPKLNQLIANIWSPSPNLHTLVIKAHFRDPWWSLIDRQYFPLHQLTTLEIDSSDEPCWQIVDVVAILLETLNLVRLCLLNVRGGLPPDLFGDEPLLLPSLQELEITGSEIVSFLGFLKTPALISLSILSYKWFHLSFASFIKHSGCGIRHLTVHVECPEVEEIIKCLRLLRSVQNLHFRRIGDNRNRKRIKFNETLADAMRERGPSESEFCLFPVLDTIKADYCLFGEQSGTAFADMVEARWSVPGRDQNRLKLLTIVDTFDDEPDMELPECSLELVRLLIQRRDGFKVEFEPKEPTLLSIICR